MWLSWQLWYLYYNFHCFEINLKDYVNVIFGHDPIKIFKLNITNWNNNLIINCEYKYLSHCYDFLVEKYKNNCDIISKIESTKKNNMFEKVSISNSYENSNFIMFYFKDTNNTY